MRLAGLVCVGALLGCTKATVIGTPCTTDKSCNVKGQRCIAGPDGGAKICTHACTSQTGDQGCPIGYDCAAADPTQPALLTCNKETYAFDPISGAPKLFGQDCSLAPGTTQAEWDAACAHSGDPAASPTCRHAADPDSRTTPRAPVRNDPQAYCTGACTHDSDCPVEMLCAKDYDGNQKCLRRGFCDPCLINDNCARGGENVSCVPTSDGSARYCTKLCGSNGDCGGLLGTFLKCAASTDSLGAGGMFCLHKFGACVGSGEVCDPCRSDADCGNGTRCYSNLATFERMCTKPCSSPTDPACAASNKPTGCDFGPPPAHSYDPVYTDFCTGDAAKVNAGVFSCFF